MANTIDAPVCPACGEARAAGDLVPDSLADVIRRQHPAWSREDVVCRTCVYQAKAIHLQDMLEAEEHTLTPLALQVIDSIRERQLVSTRVGDEPARERTRGERLADWVASAIGSWRFSSAVLADLAAWVGVNVLFRPFEPYPIIILAMISAALASLAALEGPIIMMSQRRQIKQDRLRVDSDYRVNLKAELEVRYLDEKLDRLFAQQRQLMHAQIEILERLIGQSQVLTNARGAQYGIRNTEHTSKTE